MTVQGRRVAHWVRVGRKNLKNVWWNDAVKVEVKRKEASWREVLGAKDKSGKDMYGVLQERKEKGESCIY